MWAEARRMVIWRAFNIEKKSMRPYFKYIVLPLNIKPKINLVAFTPRMVRKPGNSHIHAEDRSH